MTVPGHTSDQCSYRSEAAGLFGVVLLINIICQHYEISEGLVTMACDGLTPLRACFNVLAKLNPNNMQFDITEATRNLVRLSPITWETRHVPGHQENFPLDRWASLNSDMDVACRAHWTDSKTLERQTHIGGEPWPLWIGDRKISSNVLQAVELHVQGGQCRVYWDRRLGEGAFDCIDWEVTSQAMKGVPRGRQQWISKHSSGMCGTGKMALQMGLRPTDECPRCGEPEDSKHVWQCQADVASQLWEEQMAHLRVWLGRQGTDPRVTTILITKLTTWRNSDVVTDTYVPRALLDIVKAQEQVGWRSFLEGRAAIGWAEIQQAFYTRKRKRRSGKRWLIAVLRKMWDVAWDLWEQRNGILHDKEGELATITLDTNIREIYKQGAGRGPTELRRLFRMPLADILEMPKQQRQDWYTRVSSGVARQDRRVQNRSAYHSERRGMARFLASFQSAAVSGTRQNETETKELG